MLSTLQHVPLFIEGVPVYICALTCRLLGHITLQTHQKHLLNIALTTELNYKHFHGDGLRMEARDR